MVSDWGSSGALAPATTRYRSWVRNTALPFWAAGGFDHSAGRFHERLDLVGSPLDVPHRAMVQARQIYVFAHAATVGLLPKGGALAEWAMASLLRDFADESAAEISFAFTVTRNGAVVSATRDAYAHAFVLLALATMYRLTGAARFLELADKTTVFIERHLIDDQHGGLFDTPAARTMGKRQNPVMHLLEAYLFLEEAAPGRGYLEKSTKLVRLFEMKLFHCETAGFPEYFAADWSHSHELGKQLVMEPGHHFEWAWLLALHSRLSGNPVNPLSKVLLNTACTRGFHANGLILDFVGLDSGIEGREHRIWPHTEAMKAACAFPLFSPELSAERMASRLLGTFLDKPFQGGWIDHKDSALLPLVDYVPASSLYHLFMASTVTAEADASCSAILC